MNLNKLGWTSDLDDHLQSGNLEGFEIARVVAVHKERYLVRTRDKTLDAEITGNLRFSASGPSDFPVVGDWVATMIFDESLAIMHEILPRKNSIARQAVGKSSEQQLIASNVDFAFIMQSLDRDFNINRLERYLSITRVSGIEPAQGFFAIVMQLHSFTAIDRHRFDKRHVVHRRLRSIDQ